MHIGFIGLGNVGGKLAGSLLRNNHELTVLDLDAGAMQPFVDRGAHAGTTPRAMGASCDIVITCLPSPAASRAVVEGDEGIFAGFQDALDAGVPAGSRIWSEMSTTDEAEIKRLAPLAEAVGAGAVDCPVSGGCHRAATGNIAIFAGCERHVFDQMLPVLTSMGRQILHTGPIGSASVLKVVTNYLASANLISLTEALTTSAAAGMDLRTTYEAIRISSGNSFVHETESQVILNGSRDINFTMDLVLKDMGLFQDVAERAGVPLEVAPVLRSVFEDAAERYGMREWSPNVIRRLEDATGLEVLAPGFPAEMTDDEPEEPGAEVIV